MSGRTRRAAAVSAVVAIVAATWTGTRADEIGPEVLLGAGYNAVFRGEGGGAFAVEGRTGGLAALGPVAIRFGAAGEAATQGDFWIGAGVVASADVTDRLRVDLSFMPGGYHEGGGNDLGSAIQFRSWIGLSYDVTDRLRVGASLNHKSNAGIGDSNPGVETALVYVSHGF